MLGQDRFLGYLTVEIVAWWRFATTSANGRQQEERYKDVARRVARAQFAVSPRDTRLGLLRADAGLSRRAASTASRPPVRFNRKRIQRRSTAVAGCSRGRRTRRSRTSWREYERTAVKPEFRWSWRNAQFQFDVFRAVYGQRK